MSTRPRMLSWVTHGLLFSHDKANNLYSNFTDDMPYCHPKNGGKSQLDRAQKDYDIIFYRYIGMASHPTHPFMANEDQHEGVRCSEAITMAYNIETLLCSEAVQSIEAMNVKWVSDKTLMPPEAIQNIFTPHDNYWTYFHRANDPNEYHPYGKIAENGVKDGYYPCSLSAWNYAQYPSVEHFVEKYPFSLPLDSKIVSSWAMMTYMQEKTELWEDMGQLSVPIVDYPLSVLETEDMKDEWKKYIINLFEQRGRLQLNFRDRFRAVINDAEVPDCGENREDNPPTRLRASDGPATPENSALKGINGTRKRERSLSCDLSSVSELPRPIEMESEAENCLLAIAQTVLYERGSKFVSPTKASQAVQSPTVTRTPLCKKKLF
ncbi:MAG: hypothetical protein U1E78_01370 [Gammaproteobacteria bacterium]